EIDWRSRRGAIAEGYEDHLVAHRIPAVPAAVLADEHTLGELAAHHRHGEIQAEGGDVGAQGVIRRDRGSDLLRILRSHTVVDVLPPVDRKSTRLNSSHVKI